MSHIPEGLPMHRLLAGLGTASVLFSMLIWSRDDKPAEAPPAKLPKALGTIQPRLSPDGKTIACSYQGAIWTCPRGGGTLTQLTPSEGADTEPAWSPDGKRIAFARGGAVRMVSFPEGNFIPLRSPAVLGGTYAVTKIEFSADGTRLLAAFRVGSVNQLAWLSLDSGEF